LPRGQIAKPGDTNVSANGYHYTKVEGKWRLTHHIIAEEKLGRPLGTDERVVFADGNRSNREPSNIQVLKRTSGKSPAARLAILDSKIAELEAQREDLIAEMKSQKLA